MATKSAAKAAPSAFTSVFDIVVIVSMACYGLILIVLALGVAISSPGKTFLAILALLGVASQVDGNPVSDAFKRAMDAFRKARAAKAVAAE